MATTTNFGWTTPDDTDLVKDGAGAIRTSLNGVDTSFVDLKGGTTGQVLAKASATDLDFVWSADAAGMTNPMTTTGDVIYSSSGSTPARLGIGTDGQVLTSDGSIVGWETPSADIPLSTVTTNGDVIYATGSGAVTRLGIGSSADVLTVAGGVPTWAAPAGGGINFGNNTVNTQQSTTSWAFNNLTTTQSVTLTTGTSALVLLSYMANTSSGTQTTALATVDVSGATTISGNNIQAQSLMCIASDNVASTRSIVLALTAGSNTFTMKFANGNNSSTTNFSYRSITVIDLG